VNRSCLHYLVFQLNHRARVRVWAGDNRCLPLSTQGYGARADFFQSRCGKKGMQEPPCERRPGGGKVRAVAEKIPARALDPVPDELPLPVFVLEIPPNVRAVSRSPSVTKSSGETSGRPGTGSPRVGL